MNYPKTISNLIDCFRNLPGVGEKTAERMALSCLEMDQDMINVFSETLINTKLKIKKCDECNNLSESRLCNICTNTERDVNTLCIVEEPKNVFALEKVASYNGLYHVLGGLISPLEGINPEDLNIENMIERIKKQKIKEVIIAVKPSIEGETTSLYIVKRLEKLDVKVSKIAHGIPLGADMDYIDSMTLEMALDDRKTISKL